MVGWGILAESVKFNFFGPSRSDNITYFDRCDLSHNKMEEFKGKETASFGKEFQKFFIMYF